MTPDQFQYCVAKQSWRIAKTMPTLPHEYTRAKEWDSRKEFEDAVMCIRQHGVIESFYRCKYIYLYSGNYKYWTMGEPLEKTILINRAES